MDRAERLEKLEEKLKQMEKNPPEVKPTKQVEKQVSCPCVGLSWLHGTGKAKRSRKNETEEISRPVSL